MNSFKATATLITVAMCFHFSVPSISEGQHSYQVLGTDVRCRPSSASPDCSNCLQETTATDWPTAGSYQLEDGESPKRSGAAPQPAFRNSSVLYGATENRIQVTLPLPESELTPHCSPTREEREILVEVQDLGSLGSQETSRGFFILLTEVPQSLTTATISPTETGSMPPMRSGPPSPMSNSILPSSPQCHIQTPPHQTGPVHGLDQRCQHGGPKRCGNRDSHIQAGPLKFGRERRVSRRHRLREATATIWPSLRVIHQRRSDFPG